jgi:hypothetical protein
VKRLLGAVSALGREAVRTPSQQASRERRRDTPVRRARTCYDHLAGVAGVGLLDTMQKRGWLRPDTAKGSGYELTVAGARALARRRVDVDAARSSRRRFASACLDWTERRPHLGGALGAGVLATLCAAGYVRRRPGRRAVNVLKPLASWLAG